MEGGGVVEPGAGQEDEAVDRQGSDLGDQVDRELPTRSRNDRPVAAIWGGDLLRSLESPSQSRARPR